MNAQEADVPKSLMIVLSATMLFASPLSAVEPPHDTGVTAFGQPASRDAREAWFRQQIGEILAGRPALSHGTDEGH